MNRTTKQKRAETKRVHSLGLFVICVICLICGFSSSARGQKVVDKMVATVNAGVKTDLITYSDLLWQLALQPETPLDNPRSEDLNKALRLLIDQRLILQEAEKLPTIAPTPREVNDARDELARSRAVTVKAAQTPPERRPPIAAVRRRSEVGQRKQGAPPRSAADGAPSNMNGRSERSNGEPARPSRARSSTIAALRARQQLEGNGNVHDPIPSDTPRPLRRRRPRQGEAEE